MNLVTELKNLFIDLKSFKWSLFVSLCLLALVPAIYQTLSTAIVSSTVSTEGIDILGQMEWFDLIDETIRAFLIVPLYSVLNKIYKNSKKKFPNSVFKFGLTVFAIYALFSLIVFFYGRHLISLMNPKEADVEAINSYLMLETLSFVIGIIPTFINVVFITVGKCKNVYIFMGIKVLVAIIGDFALVPFLEVNGIAVANIISNAVLLIVGIVVLYLEKLIHVSGFRKDDRKDLGSIGLRGLFSGTQQFIDNIVYVLMVARMVNMVLEQGNYWVANNFIWGWLLIPVTSLSEVIKSDCKDDYSSLKQKNYYLIATFSVIAWAITIPLWSLFFRYVQRLENYNEIFLITIKLIPFYIAYVLCVIPDSIFVGKGATYLNAINSVFVNFLYYGVWFGCYLGETIKFTMDTIIMMFGFGMVFHLALSGLEQYLWVKHKRKRQVIEFAQKVTVKSGAKV